MILGSHNSWTYLKPKKWWMRLIAWTARCQSDCIAEQYLDGVRCFDLRIKRGKDGNLCVAHGLVEYDITKTELFGQVYELDARGDVYIRVLHEVRNESELTLEELDWFRHMCYDLQQVFRNIKFFCGRNLVNWNIDYFFSQSELSIEDGYGSVRHPRSIYALWPWVYAWLHNDIELAFGTEKEVMMIDFVNYNTNYVWK